MNLETLFEEINTLDQDYQTTIQNLQKARNVEVGIKSRGAKPLLEKAITDKTVPLIERFNLWCKAPHDIVGELSYLPTFKDRELRQKFFSAEEFNRNDEVDVRSVLSDYVCEESGKFDGAARGFGELTSEDIEGIVEEFMALNLGYFYFDW